VTETTQPSQLAPPESASRGSRFNEDWAATAVGLILVVLVLARVVARAWIP
jgi:hypothetical protein